MFDHYFPKLPTTAMFRMFNLGNRLFTCVCNVRLQVDLKFSSSRFFRRLAKLASQPRRLFTRSVPAASTHINLMQGDRQTDELLSNRLRERCTALERETKEASEGQRAPRPWPWTGRSTLALVITGRLSRSRTAEDHRVDLLPTAAVEFRVARERPNAHLNTTRDETRTFAFHSFPTFSAA